jgi:hypothetical protein
MRTRIALGALALAALVPLHAQDRGRGPATNAYLVEYHFRDGADPATATDRRYSLTVNGEHKAVFKVGNRTPAVTGSFEPVNANALVNTQYTYLDLGVNIECTLTELDSRVELHTAIDLSSVAENEKPPATGAVRNPIIKQTKLDVSTTLHVGKPTVLAMIVDPSTNRTLQVEVKVTAAN